MNGQVLNMVNLKKAFGKTEVLHDISLSVLKGEAYGLVGRNGAGKTTLLRIAAGLMRPTGGSISINTEKGYIGYMPQSCRFDDGASVADTIRFFAAIRRVDHVKSFSLCRKLELDTKKGEAPLPGAAEKIAAGHCNDG